MVKIYYNNVDIFSGLAPTPFVGISDTPIRYQSRWGVTEKVTLEGEITGQCETFQQLVDKQNALISGLSAQFKELKIVDESTVVFRVPIAKVNSVNFPSTKYSQLLPFTIEFDTFDSGKFSGFYGVLDPVNEFSFDRKNDKTVSLIHSVSAKGFQTQNDPITNAYNYVSSLTGLGTAPTPLFISGFSSPILKTVDEKINRFEGTYSVDETWVYDPELVGSGILRYAVDLDSGFEDGITRVSIQGRIEGGKNCTINDLRGRYSGISFNALAGEAYSGFAAGILNSYPLEYNFDESPDKREISFNVVYDDNPYPNPIVVDTVQLNNSAQAPGVVSVEVSFKWRGNCKCNNEYGWNQLKSAMASYNFYSKATTKWAQYGNTTTLNPNPVSKSVTENKFNCEIIVKLGYDELYDSIPIGIDSIEYNISISPAIRQYSANPSICEGQYVITDLGYDRRARYSISGRGRMKECYDKLIADFYVRNAVNLLMGQVVLGTDIVLESNSVSYLEGDSGMLFTFGFSWSANQTSIPSFSNEEIVVETGSFLLLNLGGNLLLNDSSDLLLGA
jgi:hypothetical protein